MGGKLKGSGTGGKCAENIGKCRRVLRHANHCVIEISAPSRFLRKFRSGTTYAKLLEPALWLARQLKVRRPQDTEEAPGAFRA
jgi:hypothetical protein